MYVNKMSPNVAFCRVKMLDFLKTIVKLIGWDGIRDCY